MPSAFGNERLRYARAKKKGFSLIVVLIIAIIGLAIVGGIVQMSVTSGSGGRMSSAGNTKYNFMQDAVEEGKAALKKAMDHTGDAPRYVGYNPTTPPVISQLSDLLISQDLQPWLGKGVVANRTISKADLGRLGIAGNGGTMSVMIYDMQYPTEAPDFAVPNPSRDFSRLPPSIILVALDEWQSGEGLDAWEGDEEPGDESKGVYLVRAVLTIGGKETVLDSAVIQSTNKPVP